MRGLTQFQHNSVHGAFLNAGLVASSQSSFVWTQDPTWEDYEENYAWTFALSPDKKYIIYTKTDSQGYGNYDGDHSSLTLTTTIKYQARRGLGGGLRGKHFSGMSKGVKSFCPLLAVPEPWQRDDNPTSSYIRPGNAPQKSYASCSCYFGGCHKFAHYGCLGLVSPRAPLCRCGPMCV